MSPRVSVIILNWNDYHSTAECIESLRKIHYDNYEIIIVDNDSNDNSEERLHKLYPEYRLIQTGQNLGYAGGNNRGIEAAIENKSEYILLLNNDTIVSEDFLEKLIQIAEDNKDGGLYGGKILYYNYPEKIWYAGGKINWVKGSGFSYGSTKSEILRNENAIPVTFITGCMMLIRTEVVKNIGLLEEKYFLYLEDTEYSARALRNGYNLYYCPKCIIYHKRDISEERYEVTVYYSTRNRMIFMRENANALQRILFIIYIYSVLTIKIILWLVRGKFSFIFTAARAVKDYHFNHVGK